MSILGRIRGKFSFKFSRAGQLFGHSEKFR